MHGGVNRGKGSRAAAVSLCFWRAAVPAVSLVRTEDAHMESESPRHPYRGHPAHPTPIERNGRPVIVRNRRQILANQESHRAFICAWQTATYWLVGSYVIMPEHIHLFCAPGGDGLTSVRCWAGYWKRLAGNADGRLKGAFLEDCWDTQMRSAEHYLRKLEYVRQNPVRRGLVSSPEEWPYAGYLVPLRWS